MGKFRTGEGSDLRRMSGEDKLQSVARQGREQRRPSDFDYPGMVKSERAAALAAFKNRCALCGKIFTPMDKVHLHHIGGTNHLSLAGASAANAQVAPLHEACHALHHPHMRRKPDLK